MDCPKCGTYNPEGREVCWRCDSPLPKPKPVKKKDPQKTSQRWLYVIIAVFMVLTILQTCGVQLPFMQRTPVELDPSGSMVPAVPGVALVVQGMALFL